jgi:hypothetical protein
MHKHSVKAPLAHGRPQNLLRRSAFRYMNRISAPSAIYARAQRTNRLGGSSAKALHCVQCNP